MTNLPLQPGVSWDDITRTLDEQQQRRTAEQQASQQQLPPFDPHNVFMLEGAPAPLAFTVHVLNARDETGLSTQVMALTFRTPESTTRYLVTKEYAQKIGAQIVAIAESMGSIIIADASVRPNGDTVLRTGR